jgi:SAM-dependent methyltransferase
VQVIDANKLPSYPHLQTGAFTKVFSNAAMHWILADRAANKSFFAGVHAALKPGGVFVFETGGLGNVSEMRAAILAAMARRVGLDRAVAVDPWFFPDEAWMTHMLEHEVGGFRVEKMEREWRPTLADRGGVDGWVRLMAQRFFEILDETEREACIREIVDVLRVICAIPGGGESLSYVRLRGIARKV